MIQKFQHVLHPSQRSIREYLCIVHKSMSPVRKTIGRYTYTYTFQYYFVPLNQIPILLCHSNFQPFSLATIITQFFNASHPTHVSSTTHIHPSTRPFFHPTSSSSYPSIYSSIYLFIYLFIYPSNLLSNLSYCRRLHIGRSTFTSTSSNEDQIL